MAFSAALVVLGGLYVGWALGANDGANCMGTAVGAGVRTLRQAVFLVAIFGFLGSVTLGGRVIHTIGNGIVPLDRIDPHTAMNIALAAMFAAGTWLVLATALNLPVSTTHSAVGAVAGAGLAAGTVPVYWSKFSDILLAWLLTPLGAAVLGLTLYRILSVWFQRFPLQSEKPIAALITLSGMYMAFSWGANDVANATGMIVGAGILPAITAATWGGLAIAVGVAGWGYRVMATIGSQITRLAPLMAFTAELAAALNVHLYTTWGIPVSTTHAIVGAVFGVGLANGKAAVNSGIARDIVVAWAATPVASGLVAYILYLVIGTFI